MCRYAISSLEEFSALREEIRAATRKACPDRGELLFIALNEAVNNALFHGNHRDSQKQVSIAIKYEGSQICISIRDEGSGFDHNTERFYSNELRDHGRGIEIMRYCTDCVEFNLAGNEIILRKNIL